MSKGKDVKERFQKKKDRELEFLRSLKEDGKDQERLRKYLAREKKIEKKELQEKIDQECGVRQRRHINTQPQKTKRVINPLIVKMQREQDEEKEMEQRCRGYSPFYGVALRDRDFDGMPYRD
jgi:vacuolar-type H+-ATPase subunit I/STV1